MDFSNVSQILFYYLLLMLDNQIVVDVDLFDLLLLLAIYIVILAIGGAICSFHSRV